MNELPSLTFCFWLAVGWHLGLGLLCYSAGRMSGLKSAMEVIRKHFPEQCEKFPWE